MKTLGYLIIPLIVMAAAGCAVDGRALADAEQNGIVLEERAMPPVLPSLALRLAAVQGSIDRDLTTSLRTAGAIPPHAQRLTSN